MKIKEFEDAVLEVEGIIIRVRASTSEEVDDFEYERMAAKNISTKDWLDNRIKPLLNGLEVDVISGDYVSPHLRTNLGRLRDSYDR